MQIQTLHAKEKMWMQEENNEANLIKVNALLHFILVHVYIVYTV